MNRFFLPFLCLFLILIGCQKKSQESAQSIKIGVLLPLSGDSAFIGETTKKALEMSLEDAQKNQKLKHHYQLIFEDTAFVFAKTASATQKLINVDKVDVLISTFTMSGLVSAPIAESNHVPNICFAWEDSVQKGEYNFNHFTHPAEMCRVVVQEMVKKGIKKIAVLQQNSSGFGFYLEQLKIQAEQSGVQIVSNQMFNPGQRDFRLQISKIKETKPDLVFILSLSPEADLIAKQLREQNIHLPLSGNVDDFVEKNLFEGCWYATGSAGSENFIKHYQQFSGIFPPSWAVFSYDILSMIVHVAEQNSTKPSREEIKNALLNLKTFYGVAGEVHVDTEGRFHSKGCLRQIQNGKETILNTNP
jgi:branched-chain amino acid transport system substrate-binding protein